MKQLNYGIVGCGAISQTHIRALEQIEGARVYGVCSRNQEKAAETAKAVGAKWYPDMGRMLKDSEIDVVLILTASGMHSNMGVEAARAGKHVIVEKPLDISVEKGKRLIAECEKAGVTLNCIFQHRFDEDVIALKEAIAAGRLGALYGGCCHTKWYRTQDYYDQVDWRGTLKLDGGGA